MAKNGFSLHGVTLTFQTLGPQTIGKAQTGSKPLDRALDALGSARTTVSLTSIRKHDALIGIAQEACRSLKPRKLGKREGVHYRTTDDGPVVFSSYSAAKADYDHWKSQVERALGEEFVWARDWQAVGAMHRSRALRPNTK